MSTTEPTDEMVEAAARAMWELRRRLTDPEWGSGLDLGVREEYRKDARAALRAALAVAPSPSATSKLDELLRSIIWDPKYGDDKHWGFANLSAALRHCPVPAPSDDDREEVARIIEDTASVRAGADDYEVDNADEVSRKILAHLARRSPVSPPEDVAALIEDWFASWPHYCECGNPDMGEPAIANLATAVLAAVLRAPVPVETVTTIEELDALPIGVVLRGVETWEKFDEDEWRSPSWEGRFYSRHVDLPARVLFRPTREEEHHA